MKHIITLVLVMFSLFAFADDHDERKGRRDERQEEYKDSADEMRDGGVIDKSEDVVEDFDHEENEERRDDRRDDVKKKDD